MHQLVRELAVDGIPVTVTCRVLHLARQPCYRRLLRSVSARELAEAYLANALFDAHHDDPEFGCRLLADEARDVGHQACDRRIWQMWQICSSNRWLSVFGKRRSKAGRPRPPAHDDQVRRNVTAAAPNRLWLTDITEHRTSEGELYLCAVEDVYSGRIVGYSISDRMEARLA